MTNQYVVTWFTANEQVNYYLGMIEETTFSGIRDRAKAKRFDQAEADRVSAYVSTALRTKAQAVPA